MRILGRGIKDREKLLRAVGNEGVKGISLCQVEGKNPSSLKLHLQKNQKIISKQKKFVCFDALRLSEAAVAVTTVCVSIFPLLLHVFLMPFPQLSQYSRPMLPSPAAISKRIGHTSLGVITSLLIKIIPSDELGTF